MAAPEPSIRSRRELVLSEEQLRVGTRWVQTAKLSARVRIVTEVRTIEVEVRREELVIVEREVDEGPPAADARPGENAELVFTLFEEVPVVTLETKAYERVTLHVDAVTRQEPVTTALQHEEIVDPE